MPGGSHMPHASYFIIKDDQGQVGNMTWGTASNSIELHGSNFETTFTVNISDNLGSTYVVTSATWNDSTSANAHFTVSEYPPPCHGGRDRHRFDYESSTRIVAWGHISHRNDSQAFV